MNDKLEGSILNQLFAIGCGMYELVIIGVIAGGGLAVVVGIVALIYFLAIKK